RVGVTWGVLESEGTAREARRDQSSRASRMTIHIIRTKPTPEQTAQMLEAQGSFVKLAVDVKRRIVAGGERCTPTASQCCSTTEANRMTCGARIGILRDSVSGSSHSSTSARGLVTGLWRSRIPKGSGRSSKL